MSAFDQMTPEQRLAVFASELDRKPDQPPKISPKFTALLAADIRHVLAGRDVLSDQP